jgi:quercetin dioxygenase-like cupin family protein
MDRTDEQGVHDAPRSLRARSVRIDEAEPTVASVQAAPYFIGPPPVIRGVQQALGTDAFQVNALFFEPNTRSRPHLHRTDQLLYYVRGTGVVALAGGEDQLVAEGEFVLLPGGVLHMHGASGDGPAVHISITPDVDIDWDSPIPEAWKKWSDG